ncbi:MULTISPECIES: hypothetical protein [unclassified Marinobacter]|uniref:Uncharacterized protein n=1 Tax=Marinobacter nauticus TaxID=2743 RepID=A0A455W4Z7_MARNT|nr:MULTISPECIES: hypothetical protein [unclassified Marinobacter]QFS89024.1 hypothetical protein FIV08_19445 [Marinobacter sp. THAF197a]QFT52809.1 hypothetical protein FIU96_19350 [Marinobacter sp. THAF39]BBJ04404.1 hypothetical protein YBY_22530 [Marinobacter nauticus]
MSYESLFGDEVQLVLSFCVFLLVLAVVGFILDKDSPPQLVVLVGICLVAIGGAALWYVNWMQEAVLAFNEDGKISDSFLDEFERRSNVFMFVFPFVSAAIGTNLISDVLTKKLHYEKPLTVSGVIQALPDLIGGILGFILLIPALLIITPFLIVSRVRKRSSPVVLDLLERVNRRLYLKMLKLDMVIRSWMSSK